MHAKIDIARQEIHALAPLLSTVLLVRQTSESDNLVLAPFTISGCEIVYDTMIMEVMEQEDVTFGLAVTAYMVLNKYQERGRERDPMLWAQAANMAAQAQVSDLLGLTPERVTRVREAFEERTGIRTDLPLETIYTRLAALKHKPGRSLLN